MKCFKLLGFALLAGALSGEQFSSTPEQARSMVVTKFGIVSAPQFLASDAGEILEAGGNAVDAAIAANAVMGVTQPYVNGIGGDLFAIYYEAKTGKAIWVECQRWTPKALTLEYLKVTRRSKAHTDRSSHDHGPGLRGGLGRLTRALWNNALRQAAQSGDLLCTKWISAGREKRLVIAKYESAQSTGLTRRLISPAGVAPGVGDTFRNPALADSLRLVAANGRDGFYNSKLTETMVTFLRSQGGKMHTREDFADFQPELGTANLDHLPRLDRL